MSTQKLPHFKNYSWTTKCATMGRKCLQKLLTFLSLALKQKDLLNCKKQTCQKQAICNYQKLIWEKKKSFIAFNWGKVQPKCDQLKFNSQIYNGHGLRRKKKEKPNQGSCFLARNSTCTKQDVILWHSSELLRLISGFLMDLPSSLLSKLSKGCLQQVRLSDTGAVLLSLGGILFYFVLELLEWPLYVKRCSGGSAEVSTLEVHLKRLTLPNYRWVDGEGGAV